MAAEPGNDAQMQLGVGDQLLVTESLEDRQAALEAILRGGEGC